MFDVEAAQQHARQRFDRASSRRRRADAGRSRLPEAVFAEIRASALGHDRPSFKGLFGRIAAVCASSGLKVPSRASIYNAFARIEGHSYAVAELPPDAAASLYNLGSAATVPGHQLAFHCLNYGPLSALSYAATLPWLDLHQARHIRGWRPRSRGLLAAIERARGTR
jgi:hypothetical protein